MKTLARKFILLCVIGLVSCADTGSLRSSGPPVTVRVTGVGATLADARKSGLRDAIQLAYGTLMLSERRVLNDQLFEDDVSYARGVIDRFEVESSQLEPKDNLYRVVMSVTVSPTLIEKRLFESQDAARLDGGALGKQIAIGRAQAESETERYKQARRLFEHLSKDLGQTIFDVSTGKVETFREGAEIMTYLEVTVSVNAKSLKTLCVAAREYQETRVPAVPETYRTNLRQLQVIHSYSCREDIQVEAEHFRSMLRSLKAAGICLDFKDESGNTIGKRFYGDLKIVDDGIVAANQEVPSYAQGWACGFNGGCVYSPRQVGVSTFASGDLWQNYSPDVIRIVRLPWGNDVLFSLKFPDFDQRMISRINGVKARIAERSSCIG